MLRNGNFWIGVFAGVVAVYAYNKWAIRKAAQQ